MSAAPTSYRADFAAALDPNVLAKRAGVTPYPWQARVLRSHARRQILNCARQSGKSIVTALKVMHTALYHPGSLTLILSPSERQSKLLLEKVYTAYAALGQPAEIDTENQLYLKLAHGSEIYALPGKEGTIRGFSDVDLLIIDEASRASDALYYAVRPMLAASGGALMLLSTPFGKRGFFYHAWTEGGSEWQRTELPAPAVPHFSPAFLDEERRTLPEHVFRQEYLCQFVDTIGQVFASDLIERALSADIRPLFGGEEASWTDRVLAPIPVL